MPAFQINQSVKAVRNYSTVDSCYMPHFEIEGQAHPEIGRIPLLPDNHSNEGAKAARQEAMMETVVRPEISTVSADGTHIDCPSAMSEVTDNHAIELDPYDLTNKVKAAASTKASIQVEKVKEQGLLAEIWNSLLDDLVGSKKLAKG
ncbi:hypothetical protein MMC31_003890 [Peltigera leucophlebia]|nr:hypothetical protein [Peltigera leucophlebia]